MYYFIFIRDIKTFYSQDIIEDLILRALNTENRRKCDNAEKKTFIAVFSGSFFCCWVHSKFKYHIHKGCVFSKWCTINVYPDSHNDPLCYFDESVHIWSWTLSTIRQGERASLETPEIPSPLHWLGNMLLLCYFRWRISTMILNKLKRKLRVL